MNNDIKSESFEEIDLKELLLVIFKWKWLIAGLTVIAVIVSGILSFFVLSPIYETKAVLMVTHSADNQRYMTRDDSLEGLAQTLAALPEMTMNTYVGQLKNNKLLENVATNLAEKGYRVQNLSKTVSAGIVKDTNLIEVKVTNTDPMTAALIANTLSEEFLKFISDTNKERMSQSVTVFQEQIAVIEEDLAAATAVLKEFNSQPRSIAFIEGELTAKLADLTNYQSLLIQTKIELDQLLVGKSQLEQNLAKTEPALVKETKEAQEIDPETNELSVITETMTEPNPAYHNISGKLDNQKQLVAEKQAKITSITDAVHKLELSVKELQVELTEKKSEYTKIMREVDRLERNHSLFNERLAQTQIFQSIDIGESSMMIVAPATEPTSPIKPKKSLNMAIAFVLALMIGVFLAFLLEFFDNNIKNAEDVRKHLDLPVMGHIPKINSNPKN